MKIKKLCIVLLVVLVTGFGISNQIVNIQATDFEGNEDYWSSVCTGYISSDDDLSSTCKEYNSYIKSQISDAEDEIEALQDEIDSIEGDLDALEAVSQSLNTQIEETESEIATIEANIAAAEETVEELAATIEETEASIEERMNYILTRMVQMQSKINTNQYLDYIMGASDFVELIQRASNIEQFTESDKQQIALYNEEKELLEEQLEEQERIIETLEVQQEQLEAKQDELEALKAANDALVEEYEEQVQLLLQEKNEAEAAAATLEDLSPSFTIVDGVANITAGVSSSGLIAPIQNSYISRGISQTGHRGVDYAASYGTAIVAPANCYVVYANNSYANYGYLGNMAGVPAGGGNSVRLIFEVNGVVYAMNIHHMTNSMPAINYNGTGVMVAQGTVLGYVGSSGNSSGPHAHIELFILNQTLEEAIATWYSTGDWQSGCGWGLTTPAYSSYATRVDPEDYLP